MQAICRPVRLTLIFFYLMQAVRDDALNLLNTVSARIWKDRGQAAASVRPGTPILHGGLCQEESGAAVIVGNLQSAYQDFQLHLSITLARRALPSQARKGGC